MPKKSTKKTNARPKPKPPRQAAAPQAEAELPDSLALKPKQIAFIEHYFRTWNGAEAARLAGYAENSARQQASDLLTNPYIQAAVTERLAELKMSADEVLVRLAEHARGSIVDVLDDTDEINLDEARQRQRAHLIKKLRVTRHVDSEGGVTVRKEVELYDAQAALGLIGKHLRLFVERVEHSGGVRGAGLPVIDASLLSDEELEQLENILQKVNAKKAGPQRAA